MSHLLEDRLIARVLADGSAQRALSLGVTESWFNDPLCRRAWAAIVEHGSKPATRNMTPSTQRLAKLVPGYRAPSSAPEEPLQEIIGDLNESRARAIIQAGLVDVDDLLRTQGVDIAVAHLTEIARDLQRNALTPSHLECGLADAIPEFIADYERIERGGGVVGIPFPWQPLNTATGGLQPGTLNVIYAPSKNGKTWIGLEVGVVHPFEAGNARCLMVSNEMPIKQIWRRILARLCRLEYGQVTGGTLPLDARDRSFDMLTGLQEDQLMAMRESVGSGYRDINVIKPSIADGGGVNAIRAAIERFEPDVVFIDGLYLMADDRQQGKRDNGWRTIANITQDLKALAAEKNVPIVGTTQSNREGVKRKIGENMDSYDDIGFGLGAIQDADLVMRLQKIAGREGEDRILVTLPAVREATVDAFTLRFRPVVDFELDMVNVTAEQLQQMVIEPDEAPPVAQQTRSRREQPRDDAGFTFSNNWSDPFGGD
jgi:hypothetical protein